ncbi:MAG: protein translocase subunit SecF [Chloroflexi bacterium]|nr:protein translocase subunit SecF [Chloroflexota bacterium]
MLDFVSKRYWFFALSLLVMVPGIISLATFGLKRGIEFTSGSTITLRFERQVTESELREELTRLDLGDAIIQRTGEGDFFVRTRELAAEEKTPTGEVTKPGDRERLETAFRGRFGNFTIRDFYSVSPIVAREIEQNAGRAVFVAAIAILLYITIAFRKVPRPFRYGACAVIALAHDLVVILGIFSLLGRFAGVEVDAMFLAGVLTIAGYAVHDTIVTFDRIRENALRGRFKDYPSLVNHSILETLSRSLNTTVTTLFVIVALFLFGGVTIKFFILTLLIGVIVGTYGSICNAAQLLVVWENREWGKFLSWIPGLGSLGGARAK